MTTMLKRILAICLLTLTFVGRVQYISQLTAVSEVQAQEAWDKSSLKFEGSCSGGDCSNIISAQVCNGADSEDMDGTTTYQVWFAASGNPKDGSVVANGTVPALSSGQCTTLTYDTLGVVGNYMFMVNQRPGHPGTGVLWSEQCTVNQCSQPTPTPTPSVTPTPTPSVTPTPTPSASPSPSADPSPSANPSADPSPTPGTGGRSGCYTSLANDNLQCNASGFDAVMDVIDGTTPKKDVLVRFSYNGTNKEARTNENGRAKVTFDFNGNGSVTANPEECSSQSMYITLPICPNTTVAASNSERGRGQVLGASTLAATGSSDELLAYLVMAVGTSLSIVSGLGYHYAKNQD